MSSKTDSYLYFRISHIFNFINNICCRYFCIKIVPNFVVPNVVHGIFFFRCPRVLYLCSTSTRSCSNDFSEKKMSTRISLCHMDNGVGFFILNQLIIFTKKKYTGLRFKIKYAYFLLLRQPTLNIYLIPIIYSYIYNQFIYLSVFYNITYTHIWFTDRECNQFRVAIDLFH